MCFGLGLFPAIANLQIQILCIVLQITIIPLDPPVIQKSKYSDLPFHNIFLPPLFHPLLSNRSSARDHNKEFKHCKQHSFRLYLFCWLWQCDASWSRGGTTAKRELSYSARFHGRKTLETTICASVFTKFSYVLFVCP